ncbi:MAG: hypothetical protein RIB45_04395 [Marivibrio sp.]|uniref:hypothetical protein n=1 Tax=Marivibrio sp. TaxID=2039719 RepID=UPI0032EFA7CB
MARTRFSPRPTEEPPGEPFPTVEEAWLWAVERYDSTLAGARARAGRGVVQRAGDPRDVVNVAARLLRTGALTRDQAAVLFQCARNKRLPDPRVPEERAQLRAWRAALARLEPPLVAKGLVSAGSGGAHE